MIKIKELFGGYLASGMTTTKRFSVTEIEKIQLEAFKAGMTEAARICNEDFTATLYDECEQAILTARDNKTTI